MKTMPLRKFGATDLGIRSTSRIEELVIAFYCVHFTSQFSMSFLISNYFNVIETLNNLSLRNEIFTYKSTYPEKMMLKDTNRHMQTWLLKNGIKTSNTTTKKVSYIFKRFVLSSWSILHPLRDLM